MFSSVRLGGGLQPVASQGAATRVVPWVCAGIVRRFNNRILYHSYQEKKILRLALPQGVYIAGYVRHATKEWRTMLFLFYMKRVQSTVHRLPQPNWRSQSIVCAWCLQQKNV